MAYQDARKDYLTKCAVEALGATTPSNQWATSPESMYSAVHGAAIADGSIEDAETGQKRELGITPVVLSLTITMKRTRLSYSPGLSAPPTRRPPRRASLLL